MSRALDLALPATLAAAATTVAAAALEAHPPGGRDRWARENYAGRHVTLLGGAAAAAGAVAGALAGAPAAPDRPGARALTAAAVAAAAGAGMGLLDDLGEGDAVRTKGLRGHLGALAHGQVTTGALKILGIGAGAAVASAVLTPPRTAGRAASALAGAALIAGTANLYNLLDLRPGRALKATAAVGGAVALSAPGTPRSAVAATALGVAAAALPDDLGERTMLGDTGANAVGALVGTALAAHPSRVVRGGALAVVVALTLLSERVSFSRVIETTPALHRLDALGRRG